MRKAFFLLFAAAAMLFCACTAKDGLAKPAQETMQAPSWQAQYDLGVRYLSEENYEEAILAFTAAIEIDPKRPEAYKQLAEVYYELGEDEKAENILRQGYEETGDNSLKLEEPEDELTKDERTMANDLLESLANHDMEHSHDILASDEFEALIMRNGTADKDPDYPISYLTLGSPDSGAIITYDARRLPAEIRCVFGQWKDVGHTVDGGAIYHPQGDCIYYQSMPANNLYVFTAAHFEDGLTDGACEKNVVQYKMQSITTMSGTTTNGLWNGTVTIRSQWFWANVDETGEAEFVDGVPILLGYTGTGSTKFPCYSRSLKTGELLTASSAGAIGYSENTLPYPYDFKTHSYSGETDPYEFAENNMRLSEGLPYVWGER